VTQLVKNLPPGGTFLRQVLDRIGSQTGRIKFGFESGEGTHEDKDDLFERRVDLWFGDCRRRYSEPAPIANVDSAVVKVAEARGKDMVKQVARAAVRATGRRFKNR
jgi:hypothetical protein